MLELRIKQGRKHVPLFDIPAYLGRAEAYRELGDTIDGLIAFMDDLDGDPDLESGSDAEDDFAFSPLALHFAKGPGCEASDIGEEHDDSGQSTEDEISSGWPGFGDRGPGCTISDPDAACDDFLIDADAEDGI